MQALAAAENRQLFHMCSYELFHEKQTEVYIYLVGCVQAKQSSSSDERVEKRERVIDITLYISQRGKLFDFLLAIYKHPFVSRKTVGKCDTP